MGDSETLKPLSTSKKSQFLIERMVDHIPSIFVSCTSRTKEISETDGYDDGTQVLETPDNLSVIRCLAFPLSRLYLCIFLSTQVLKERVEAHLI